MKKTYIQPDILIVKMATKRHLLTPASNPDVKISTDDTDVIDPGVVESRRRGGGYNWDDDEEDY